MKKLILSIQHVLAMFGSTVLVPLLTGIPVSITIFAAGLGTILFHWLTKRKVPIFLGSSFAFIGGIMSVKDTLGLAYATGAIVIAGGVYVLGAVVVKIVGYQRFIKLFPPIVIAPIILTIGLSLAPNAVDMAAGNWWVAVITMAAAGLVGVYAKGFLRLLPIISCIGIGYIAAIIFGLVDFTKVVDAPWFALPDYTVPKFSWYGVSVIVPLALVSMVEHIGDVTTNGAVVGKNFLKDPGLHRTLFGDGAATSLAGLLGAPANTTYSENTGTLALTKVYDPAIIRGAALIAIVVSFSGKLMALVRTIPEPVLGGASFILFGMIASIGVKQLVDNDVDLSNIRHAIVFFIPVMLGLTSPAESIGVSGLALSAIAAVVLNLLLVDRE